MSDYESVIGTKVLNYLDSFKNNHQENCLDALNEVESDIEL